jgi:hypothetical protein
MLRRVAPVRTDISEELSTSNRWTRNNVSRNLQPTHTVKSFCVMLHLMITKNNLLTFFCGNAVVIQLYGREMHTFRLTIWIVFYFVK